MKLATGQRVWIPTETNKTGQKRNTSQSALKAGALRQVPPKNILFGTPSPEITSSTLEREIKTLTERAPRIFGKPFVPESEMPLLKKRAFYNLNFDPAELTQYFPYRQRLTQKNDHQHLKQYDQLVKALMNKAEFYEVEKITTAKKNVSNLYINILKNLWKELEKKQGTDTLGKEKIQGTDTLWHKIKRFLSRIFNPKDKFELFLYPLFDFKSRQKQFRTTYTLMSEISKQIPEQTLLKQLTQSGVKPLADPSTRYLIASSITELLFKNPEQAQNLLNNPKHPLRFVVGKESAKLTKGQFKPGFNLLFLNEQVLWKEAVKGMKESYTSQHEFVHAMADSTGGEFLPNMSEAQKRRFLKARSELEAIYSKKDAGITGLLRRVWNRHTATGLRIYAFFNYFEFLTVTLDTFNSNPKELCRTQPGRDLYQLYKEIFGIDPLRDFKLN